MNLRYESVASYIMAWAPSWLQSGHRCRRSQGRSAVPALLRPVMRQAQGSHEAGIAARCGDHEPGQRQKRLQAILISIKKILHSGKNF